MEPPFDRLPSELLALIFEDLTPEERALCAMARQRWQAIIKYLWPALRNGPNEILEWAAENGHIIPMKFTKKWGTGPFDEALQIAAQGGHIDCLKLLKKWGVSYFGLALQRAAEKGHIDCLKLLKKWGATHFNWALKWAAGGGHTDCLKLLKKWGATNFSWALEEAAEGGHTECLKLLKVWGAKIDNKALRSAAEGVHQLPYWQSFECLRLATEQPLCPGVRRRDCPIRIESDDAFGSIIEHGAHPCFALADAAGHQLRNSEGFGTRRGHHEGDVEQQHADGKSPDQYLRRIVADQRGCRAAGRKPRTSCCPGQRER